MKRVRIRRKGTEVPSPARQAEQAARRQLLWAAGAEQFKHRDPVSFVTESFCQTFDASLRRRAISEGEREFPHDGAKAEGEREASYPDPTSTRPFYERQTGERQDMLRRFSETALQRGTLSGAVLRGSGRMMLFSCLKKTVGQSEPVHWQQRKLFEKSAKARNVPGHGSDRVAFNPGFAESAVALVVDALKDARRTVETLMDMANGRGIGGSGAKTLRKMYPFLDDSRERALLKTYRERLKGMDESDPARPILVNAAGRAEALIAKKAQMKQEFVSKLRVLSERANRALAEWEQPAFALELRAALIEAAAEEPPEDGGGRRWSSSARGRPASSRRRLPGRTASSAGAAAVKRAPSRRTRQRPCSLAQRSRSCLRRRFSSLPAPSATARCWRSWRAARSRPNWQRSPCRPMRRTRRPLKRARGTARRRTPKG